MKTEDGQDIEVRILTLAAEMATMTEFEEGAVKKTCSTCVVKGRRCKQTGMHWHIHNTAEVSALIAKYRSEEGKPRKLSTN